MFRKGVRALRIVLVPDGTTWRISRAIADSQTVHIALPGRSANFLHVIDVPPLSGLVVVLRPRRRAVHSAEL
ncbi:hypothetical protein ACIBO9_28390 [Streptomyces prunicolor]|uniref:hypothetical protein n=1 Tax=Streptomyces prunicolor TaxID=67348 RepID=UPI0037D45530